MTAEHIDLAMQVIPWILVVVSQGAAIFGKPAIVAAIKPISALFDVLAGNYRKAQNQK